MAANIFQTSFSQISETQASAYMRGRNSTSSLKRAREIDERKRKQAEKDATSILGSFVRDVGADCGDGTGSSESVDGNLPKVKKNISKKQEINDFLSSFQDKAVRGETFDASASARAGNFSQNDASHGSSSYDDDSSEREPSTNVFVSNIAPTVTEEVLRELFAQWGRVASVKIMWPRTHEERARGRNTGFVAYFVRAEAEQALDALLGGITLQGMKLGTGWGKALDAKTLRELDRVDRSNRAKNVGREGGDTALRVAAVITGAAALSSYSGGPRRPQSSFAKQASHTLAPVHGLRPNHSLEIRSVRIPKNPRVRAVIDTVARYVARDGSQFESAFVALKCGGYSIAPGPSSAGAFDGVDVDVSSSTFYRRFLLEKNAPEHVYYRWKVFSLCQGDELFSWMVNQEASTFIMERDGPTWRPPQQDQLTLKLLELDQLEEEERMQKQRSLPAGSFLASRDKRDFLQLLDSLTLERSRINELMRFALIRSYAAPDIISTIMSRAFYHDSLTPAPVMVTHLYLISDLLHNSGSSRPHASTFRTHIEVKLPEIFKVMGKAHQGITGRLSAKAMEIRVEKVLSAWDKWGVFTSRFLDQLRCSFRNTDSAARQKEMKAESHAVVLNGVEMEPSSQSHNLSKPEKYASQHDSEGTSLNSQIDGEAFDPDEF